MKNSEKIQQAMSLVEKASELITQVAIQEGNDVFYIISDTLDELLPTLEIEKDEMVEA